MDSTDGPIRSRFRGLSWDKKHQGWRVRIYYSGKQRHVGRFEEDIAAARAYDKAAVYLYGANAITNFGIQACQDDPTEVSAFIVLAKEQADQEQQARGQLLHQQYGHTPDGYNAQQLPAMPQLMMLPNGLAVMQQQQQQLPPMQQHLRAHQHPGLNMVQLDAWQQQQQQQQQQAALIAGSTATGGLHYAHVSSDGYAGASGAFSQPPQQQWQLPGASLSSHQLQPLPSPLGGGSVQYVVLPAASPMEASSNAIAPALSTSSNATTSSALSSTSNFSSMVQAVVVPGAAGAVAAAPASSGLAPGSSSLGPHQLQPAGAPLTDLGSLQQRHHSPPQQVLLQHLNGAVLPQGPQQHQQHQQQQPLMFLCSQPLQLSVQPQLTTIASHLTAHSQAQQAVMQQQQQQQQQVLAWWGLQGQGPASAQPQMGVSSAPLTLDATAAGLSSHMQQQQLAAAAGVQANSSRLQQHTQQQQQQQQQAQQQQGNMHASLMLAAGSACSSGQNPFVEDMLQGLGYAAAVAPGPGAGPGAATSPLQQQQQQQLAIMAGLVPGAGWASSQAMAECGSSSCSPMVATACAAPLPGNVLPAVGAAAGSGGCKAPVLQPRSPPTAAGPVGSPTCSTTTSSGSSGSKSFGLREHVAC